MHNKFIIIFNLSNTSLTNFHKLLSQSYSFYIAKCGLFCILLCDWLSARVNKLFEINNIIIFV